MADADSHLAAVQASLVVAKSALPSLDSLSGTTNGISLLSLKSHLLLSYLQHLSFYILLKARGEKVDDGEFAQVVAQLIDLRVYLDKGVKPIESKLRYQIDKVIRAAERVDREGQIKDLDDGARDALAYKPNPQALVIDKTEESVEGDGIYRPPRIASTLPARETLQRRKAPNKTLQDFADSELSAAPVAEPSIGSNIITQGRQGNSTIQTARDRTAQSERDKYEEENYLRLPTNEKQKKGRKNDDIYGGEDFRILDQELYDLDKGPREGLVERSRKRAQEGTDTIGDPNGNGTGKFKKRKKLLAGRAKHNRR